MKNGTELLNINNIDLKSSFKLFQDLSVKATKYYEKLPPINAENMDFGEDFLGGLIQKPNYINCRFNKTTFDSPNGAYSNLEKCYFGDCYFYNCDFRYSNFKNCIFTKEKKFTMNSINFSFSTLYDCEFNKIDFIGVSYREMILSNVEFNDCTINSSAFEHTKLIRCTFRNIDFKNVGVRYCEFIDCKFINVTFPILDVLSNYGLLEALRSNNKEIKVSLGNNGITDFDNAVKILCDLVPYYETVHQYFELINLCIIYEEPNIMSNLILKSLEYVIKQNDFEGLENICKLIVNLKNNNTSESLKNVDLIEMYHLIISLINPDKLPYNLYKSYIDYINKIRLLLVDNPYNNPTGQIIIKTHILPEETEDLAKLIKSIDDFIRDNIPSTTPYIQISHHCPYEIIVAFAGALPEILQVCQIFYYTFGGIKALKDICGSIHEKAINIQKPKKDKYLKLKKAFNFDGQKIKINSLIDFEMKVESVEYFITNDQ